MAIDQFKDAVFNPTDPDGGISITGSDLSIGGDLDVDGETTFNGDITIGNTANLTFDRDRCYLNGGTFTFYNDDDPGPTLVRFRNDAAIGTLCNMEIDGTLTLTGNHAFITSGPITGSNLTLNSGIAVFANAGGTNQLDCQKTPGDSSLYFTNSAVGGGVVKTFFEGKVTVQNGLLDLTAATSIIDIPRDGADSTLQITNSGTHNVNGTIDGDWSIGGDLSITGDTTTPGTYNATGGSTSGDVIWRTGQTETEGLELHVIDEDVVIASPGTHYVALSQNIPANSILISIQANLETAVTVTGTPPALVKIGISDETASPDKYGTTTDLTKNQKIDTFPDWTIILASTTTMYVTGTTSLGGVPGQDLDTGTVRVRLVYYSLNSLDDAP